MTDLGARGRVALVTGASSGMGRATALSLADAGYSVACCDVQRERADGDFGADRAPTDELVAQSGMGSCFIRMDVGDEDDVRDAFASCRATLGGLNAVVSNAGVAQVATPIHEARSDEFDRVMRINARGVWLCCREAVRAFLSDGTQGSIVNVASIYALTGYPGESAYCASKGAVVALTRSVALDVAGRGITVNAVCPGFVKTAMARTEYDQPGAWAALESSTPLGRVAEPEEVAAVTRFLLSDGARYLTGSVVTVDGGFTAT